MTEQFVKIPFLLLKDEQYSDLSLSAIVLYSLLMDRLDSSKRKGEEFKDEDGEFYAVMTRDEIVDTLRVGKNKVPKIKKELIDHGLLEEKNRGSRTTLYYPQNLKIESGNAIHAFGKPEVLSPEIGRNDVPKSGDTTPMMSQNRAQWSPKIGRNDVPKSGTNQTNYNQTDNNQTCISQDRLNNISSELQNYALMGLGKIHFSPLELDKFRADVREAIEGNEDQAELIRFAVDEAKKNGASSWNYVSTVLKNWRSKGVTSVSDLEKMKKDRKKKTSKFKVEDWMNF